MMGLKVTGLGNLQKALKANVTLDDVKEVVKNHGSALQRRMQREAEFRGHYEWEKGKGMVFTPPTGNTKDHIMLRIENGGLAAEVKPTTEYASYLEYGTRFMEAQPFVRPAFEIQKVKFMRSMNKLIRKK